MPVRGILNLNDNNNVSLWSVQGQCTDYMFQNTVCPLQASFLITSPLVAGTQHVFYLVFIQVCRMFDPHVTWLHFKPGLVLRHLCFYLFFGFVSQG